MNTDEFREQYKLLEAKYKKAIFPTEPNKPDLNNLDEVKEWIAKQEKYLKDLVSAQSWQANFEELNKKTDRLLQELGNEYTGINDYKINAETKGAIRDWAWSKHHSDGGLAVIEGVKDILEQLFFEFKSGY